MAVHPHASWSITLVPGEMDTGVVQIDGLRPDERDSRARAGVYERLSSRAEEEAARLETEQAGIVISDAPPLACAAAKLARIPSVVCANFTWDWIYSGYGEAPGVDQLVSVLRETYALADAGWRLPMHGGFESFGTVVDVPFVARHSRSDRTRRQIHEALRLPVARPLALVSFGGYGVRDLPIDRIDCLDSWGIVITTPDKHVHGLRDGVHAVSEDLIYESGLRYEDLVRAVDVVVTKPGYGIISDCLANDTGDACTHPADASRSTTSSCARCRACSDASSSPGMPSSRDAGKRDSTPWSPGRRHSNAHEQTVRRKSRG